MAYRDKKSTKLKGLLILGLIRFNYWLPHFLSYAIGLLIAKLGRASNSKITRVIRRNIELCFPDLEASQAEKLLFDTQRQNAYMTKEFATAWLAPRAKIERHFTAAEGASLLDELVADKQPVILAVPHIGNWEYLWQWLQFNYPIIGMYQPAKFDKVDKLVLDARQRFGGRVFPTDAKGIMGLLRSLKQGKVMMILPDQAPREGAGIYSPFYGHPAYTMTLLHKFVSKTKAKLLFASCLRQANGRDFKIHIEQPNFDYDSTKVEDFNVAMNQQIEQIIDRTPAQYQWTYKRFKRQPEGKSLY